MAKIITLGEPVQNHTELSIRQTLLSLQAENSRQQQQLRRLDRVVKELNKELSEIVKAIHFSNLK